MNTIIGVAFCILWGVTTAIYGISAILWFPLGFIIGIFVSAQILLPLLLGLPRAISLVAKREIRTAVIGRILLTPLVWFVIIAVLGFAAGFLFPSVADFVYSNAPLNFGGWVGTLAIVLSPLSAKSRADFRTDFDEAYAGFYTFTSRSLRFNLQLRNSVLIPDSIESARAFANRKDWAELPWSAHLHGSVIRELLSSDEEYDFTIAERALLLIAGQRMVLFAESLVGTTELPPWLDWIERIEMLTDVEDLDLENLEVKLNLSKELLERATKLFQADKSAAEVLFASGSEVGKAADVCTVANFAQRQQIALKVARLAKEYSFDQQESQ